MLVAGGSAGRRAGGAADVHVAADAPAVQAQLGVHPGGNTGYWDKMWAGDYSFYEDPSVTDDYVVAAGGEKLENYLVDFKGPTDERYYYRRYFRGRYGSHHGTVTFTGSPVTEGCAASACTRPPATLITTRRRFAR